jgi:hypothetical protein
MQENVVEEYKEAFMFSGQYCHPVSCDHYGACCRATLATLARLGLIALYSSYKELD